MANVYDYGDLVRITGTFTDASSVVQDPSSVFFQYKTPAGSTTAYTYGTGTQIVRSGAGTYYYDLNCSTVGWWSYRWYATGTGQSAGEGALRVQESEFD
jgi:hypothetical protein